MSMPLVTVEVAFDNAPSGSPSSLSLLLDSATRGLIGTNTVGTESQSFIDVTSYVRGIEINRGSNRVDSPVVRYEAGTASIVLDNRTRIFDPTNLSGPFVVGGVTQVTPMRAVRVRSTVGSVTYDLFRGFADAWTIDYNSTDSTCTLTATDATKVLSAYDRVAVTAVGAGETSTARIARILDSVSFTDGRLLDSTAYATLSATTLDRDAWTELLQVVDSELGEFYIDGAGNAFFRNRQRIVTDVRSASVMAAFGTSATTFGYGYVVNGNVGTLTTGGVTGATTNTDGSVTGTSSSTDPQFLWNGISVPYDMQRTQIAIGLTVAGGGTVTGQLYWASDLLPTIVASQRWDFTVTADGTQREYIINTATLPSGTVPMDLGNLTQLRVDPTSTSGVAMTVHYVRVGGYELPFDKVQVEYDDTTIANTVRIARVGGTQQSVTNSASATAYLPRSLERTDLLYDSDAQSLDMANFLLNNAKDPELRISTLDVQCRADDTRLFPVVAAARIGNRYRVTLRPPGGGTLTRDVFLRGWRHSITPDKWNSSWTFQSADRFGSSLIVGSPVLGMVDTATVGF